MTNSASRPAFRCPAPFRTGRGHPPLAVLACLLGGALLGPLAPLPARAQEPPLTGQSLVITPDNVLALHRVNAAIRQGHRQDALRLADEALQQFPEDLQLRFTKAVLLSDLGRTDEAVTVLEALSNQFPELPEPYNNLAAIRAAQGRQLDAERLLKQAIATQSNYLTARENLADLYIGMAVTAYNEALKLDPHNEALLKKRDQALELANRLAPASPRQSTPASSPSAGTARP